MYPCVFEASEGQWYQPGPPQHFHPIGILGGPLDEQVITARCLLCVTVSLSAIARSSCRIHSLPRQTRRLPCWARQRCPQRGGKRSVFVVSTSDYGIDSGTDGPLKGAHHYRDKPDSVSIALDTHQSTFQLHKTLCASFTGHHLRGRPAPFSTCPRHVCAQRHAEHSSSCDTTHAGCNGSYTVKRQVHALLGPLHTCARRVFSSSPGTAASARGQGDSLDHFPRLHDRCAYSNVQTTNCVLALCRLECDLSGFQPLCLWTSHINTPPLTDTVRSPLCQLYSTTFSVHNAPATDRDRDVLNTLLSWLKEKSRCTWLRSTLFR